MEDEDELEEIRRESLEDALNSGNLEQGLEKHALEMEYYGLLEQMLGDHEPATRDELARFAKVLYGTTLLACSHFEEKILALEERLERLEPPAPDES